MTGFAEITVADVRAVESRAEVDSLATLHAERRKLLERLAPLKALHGHGGLYDDKRKQLLEAMKIRARQTLAANGDKITEGLVDAMAYGDAQYEAFLDKGVEDRIEYIMLANELSELEEKIENRQTCLLVYNSELRLAR